MIFSPPLIYWVDFLAIASFLSSYYFNCYRKGYRIDFWHIGLFFSCVLPNFIMLPFATEPLNALILGSDYRQVVRAVPLVFYVTLIGYVSVILGGFLWRIDLGIGLRRAATSMLDVIPRCSLMVMSSQSFLLFTGVLCLTGQTLLLLLYFAQNGFGFDLRAYTFSHPTLRPLALFISNCSVFIASHSAARYVDTKRGRLLGNALLLAFGLFFFGARANLILIFLNILLCYLIQLRQKTGLLRLCVIFVTMAVVVLYLGAAREGNFGVSEFLNSLAFLLFYGNTFSDLRDFAWVYADWDHAFWHGKTYLAAVTSFVPRFASSFRDAWGLGAATASTVGFDPHVHPGLRPGSFGESYLNFGLLGVIIMGVLIGVITRRVDVDTKLSLTTNPPSMMRAFASTQLLGLAGSLSVSAGFSTLYITFALFAFAWISLQLQALWCVPACVTETHRNR